MTSNVHAGTLDDVYFEWLYSHIASTQNQDPAKSFWRLAYELYTTPFFWFIPNDDNRVADGKELRLQFLQETGYQLDDPYALWFDLDCSMFEMLIGLSRRVAFETDAQPVEWFWRLIQNLELDRYTDDIFEISIQEEVREALDRVNRRTYSPDGTGGLFPLREASRDQRKVELAYQMGAYLLEGYYVNNRPRW